MKYEVIDFHTHPFLTAAQNICSHKESCGMSAEETLNTMRLLGVSAFCGSVIAVRPQDSASVTWEELRALNDSALLLRQRYGGAYIPGFHVHPGFVKESCEEIERMEGLGVNLIGELVPYFHGWKDYSLPEFDTILSCAEAHKTVVSFHSMGEDQMDRMVEKHPGTVFVAAHPGEYGEFSRHMERMRMSRNYYLDLSGYGIFRYGMLRHAVDLFGPERFLYGSDFPTCSPAMYLAGVENDLLIREDEKRLILAGNAKRLLHLG